MANDVMAKRLRQLRQDKGVSQDELSKWLSVSRTSYTKYETGIYEPSIETLVKLAGYYGVSVDYIIGYSDSCITYEHCTDDEQNIIAMYRRYSNKEVIRDMLAEPDTLSNLAEDEQELVVNYRKSVKSSKQSLLDYSGYLVELKNRK